MGKYLVQQLPVHGLPLEYYLINVFINENNILHEL